MDHFNYANDVLHAEGVDVRDIARNVGTPFYCYSTATLTRHYNVLAKEFADIDALICFAVKANSNLSVLKTLANLGAGGDCVSEGEIRRCRAAGIDANKIVFSGVGKTEDELAYALREDIFQFNVESYEELESLNAVAGRLGKKAPIAIRVNPDVDAGSHDKISTGRKEDKFGIAWENASDIYSKAASFDNIEIKSIATHIGSQLTSLIPMQNAFSKIKQLVLLLRQEGHNIERIDFGGGLGIPYEDENPPTPASYASVIKDIVKDLGCKVVLEPGRLICGNAGILVSQVIYLKHTDSRKFLVIDAAMNDLVRPSMYNAFHEIVPVEKDETLAKSPMDIVGPVCETGDTFAKQRILPHLAPGSLIAIRSCGAYGAVMASEYNSRPLIAETMVNADKYAIVRQRGSYQQMLNADIMPEWVG